MGGTGTPTAHRPPPTAQAAAQRALDLKTKPLGSLGRLEELAARLAELQNTLAPVVDPARVIVFAADHGVAAEGVSAYPPQVTGEMMRNFAAGGAAINVLARANGLEVEVVDVGVDAELGALAGIVHAKVRRGTRNFLHEPAMRREELDQALDAGRAAVARARAAGVRAVGLGEMGIGNTTTAAALLAAYTGAAPATVVGRGTGVDDAGVARKAAVVAAALARHQAALGDARATLASLGGLEIAAIVGAAVAAAEQGVAVVVDGFIATVAALAAVRLAPGTARALFFAHRSAERGHEVALGALDARPLLDLELRLGEGTGAALALPLLRAAARVLTEMATFDSAGVSGRAE